jgi:hypothetical protein
MRNIKRGLILTTVCAAWALITVTGFGALWKYENRPGPSTTPPANWPMASKIDPAHDRATLIMLAHPLCPCTRASIGELSRLMAQAQGRVSTYVIFVESPGIDEAEKSDLWRSAASIPGVKVIADDGSEARRFHAVTSGQTALYDTAGRLLFSGGITESRGHSGDNPGRTAIVSLLNSAVADRTVTRVFGCPLFGSHSDCLKKSNDEIKH